MSATNKQVTLFLVEDDDIDYITMKRSFKQKRIGNPILRARDGQEALDWLKANDVPKPFIMLLDLQMPRMNGVELLSEIRSDAELADSTVFILTTSKDETDIMASYQHNVAGYFVKDEAGEEFLSVVDLLDGYWRIVHLPV